MSYYSNLAKNYGHSPQMSLRDQNIRDHETRFILESIHYLLKKMKKTRKVNIIDLGSGNGYTLNAIKQKYLSSVNCFGIEINKDLINIAKEYSGIQVFEQSLLDKWPIHLPHQFDVIICQRVIINILSKKKQREALFLIKEKLFKGGVCIFIESFSNPFFNLNQARKELKLSLLEISSHNKFLSDNYLNRISQEFIILNKKSRVYPPHFLSTYFFLTRVLHPLLRPQGGKVRDSHLVNFLINSFPSSIGDYSPIKFFLLSR